MERVFGLLVMMAMMALRVLVPVVLTAAVVILLHRLQTKLHPRG